MSKRFKTLSGFITYLTPVKSGKKDYDYAHGRIQTGTDNEEKLVFLFKKPSASSATYEAAEKALSSKASVTISGMSQDTDGTFMVNRSSEIRRRNVTFQRDINIEENIGLSQINDGTVVSQDDCVTITGCVTYCSTVERVLKFDNTKNKKLEKKLMTIVVADSTGASLLQLWEQSMEQVKLGQTYCFTKIRRATDAQGENYMTSTFQTEIKNMADIEYNENAAEEYAQKKIVHNKTVVCEVLACKTDVVLLCPRCATKCTSTEIIVTCVSCAATFKAKNLSVKTEINVEEAKTGQENKLIVYKDILLEAIGKTDEHAISNYFLGDMCSFEITFHHKSKSVSAIKKLSN